MADEFKSLADSVVFALKRGGTAILDHPQQLLSYLADTMDPDGMEMRVLMRCCDDQLIEPYRKALGNGPEALSTAESRARDHLINECMIEPRTAAAVSTGIARGIAMRFGVGAPAQQQPVVPPTVMPQPQPTNQGDAQASGWGNTGRTGSSVGSSANYPHTIVVTPQQQVPQQPQTPAQPVTPQPQTPPQPVTPQPQTPPQQPAPQPQPVAQQPKKKSPLPIIAAVAAVVVAAVLVLPRLLGGGGSAGSSRGGVFTLASEDEGMWLLTDYTTVTEDGTVTAEGHVTYDAHGNRLTESSYNLWDDGSSYKTDYTYSDYDEYGYESSLHYVSEHVNESGESYETTTTVGITNDVDSSGHVTERWAYSFYESGDYTSNTDYHSTYTYNGDKLSASTTETTDDSSVRTEKSSYDEYGHWIGSTSKTVYDDGDTSSSESTSTYELRSDGTPISEVYVYTHTSFDGEVTETRYEYTYDEDGRIVKSVYTDSDGKVETNEFTFELDSNGNIKTRTNIRTGEVTTYTYTYISDPSFVVRNDLPRGYY